MAIVLNVLHRRGYSSITCAQQFEIGIVVTRFFRLSAILSTVIIASFPSSGIAFTLKPIETSLGLSSVLAQSPTGTDVKASTVVWQEFSSDKGGFKVNMPGTPTEEIHPASSDGKIGDTHLFIKELENGKIAYLVGYTDFTNSPTSLSPSQINSLFSSVRNGAVGKGRLLTERTVALDNHPGREIHFEDSDGLVYKARIYLVKQRLYQVMVVANTSSELQQAAEKFFNSFTLLADTAKEGSEF